MRILIVGSGGREHALAWKIAKSRRVERLYIAPGNGGTAAVGQNVAIAATDIPALLAFALENSVDLTVVGPEAPLVAGLVDTFTAAGLPAFGPTAAAARLEGSKAFAKRFMIEEGIPTAPATVFSSHEAARLHLRGQQPPLVVKASGLASGKGVTVCATMEEAEQALREAMVERVFGAAGDTVVIEEYLAGQEVSLLAFCDGHDVVPLLPARDYKRVADGDHGPNTGGMGGYAPSAHMTAQLADEVLTRVLRPAVDGMRRRGSPYVGVLYAGLMLTTDGPRVLEFNCRFGDPETQVLLPLLETDLLRVLLACVEGRLAQVAVRWKPACSAAVVLAAPGYPGQPRTGEEIGGMEEAARLPRVVIFHAGTRSEHGRLVTSGGRVLSVVATGKSLDTAVRKAYAAVQKLRFSGMHYRRDIGAEALAASDGVPARRDREGPGAPVGEGKEDAYAAAGVDIGASTLAVDLMRDAVRSTYTREVLAGIGAFGGLFDITELCRAASPVLVASTDGVGTKTLIAAALGRYETVGHDIVNHCVNDILVQGARPLFFLDYIASGKLDPAQAAEIVSGCAAACRAVGCALLGGETAEMPGVYAPGTFDLVGTMVGWVKREDIVDGRDVRPGDVVLGLPSSGLHTNGYSLARRAFAGTPWDRVLPELGRPLGEVLLTPHRAYLHDVERLWAAGVRVKGMAHLTGGGFVENIPRVLPPGVGVRLDRAKWAVPRVFSLIQLRAGVTEAEMYRVFNMGIGMVLLLSPEQAIRARQSLPEAVLMGEVVEWDGAAPRVDLGLK